jgi:hypothetical protein
MYHIYSEREREKSHSPRRTGNEEDPNLLLGDELTVLGFPEEVEAMHVFESTGECKIYKVFSVCFLILLRFL